MSDIALPRARSRRRKIKPPRPSFWWALACVIWDLLFTTWDFFGSLPSHSTVTRVICGVCGAIMVTHLVLLAWPRFRRELDRWKADQ